MVIDRNLRVPVESGPAGRCFVRIRYVDARRIRAGAEALEPIQRQDTGRAGAPIAAFQHHDDARIFQFRESFRRSALRGPQDGRHTRPGHAPESIVPTALRDHEKRRHGPLRESPRAEPVDVVHHFAHQTPGHVYAPSRGQPRP